MYVYMYVYIYIYIYFSPHQIYTSIDHQTVTKHSNLFLTTALRKEFTYQDRDSVPILDR